MKIYRNSWIGFDLDRTLAEYTDWKGSNHIGEPIKPMIDKLHEIIESGINVKILTARVAPNNESTDPKESPEESRRLIKEWCKKHIGYELDVVCEKDYAMLWFYDDRCVQVEPNTGKIIGKDFEL